MPTREDFRAELQALYARVPGILCKGLCSDSCTRIDATVIERALLKDRGVELPPPVLHRRHLELIAQGDVGNCPGLGPLGNCKAYTDRPLVCRVYGTQRHLICEHRCMPDSFVSDGEMVEFVLAVQDISRRWVEAGRP